MKKLLASILCITILMSLAACNSNKQPGQTTAAAISGTTAETSAAASSEPSAETTVKTNPALEYVKDNVVNFTIKGEYDEEEKTREEDEILAFHIPEVLIKSSYADSINKAINKIVDGYKKDFKNGEETGVWGAEFIAYLTKDGVLSLVFIELGDNDCNEFHVYNIDVKTGEKVDNSRIAQIAGVSSIRKAAMDALTAQYNSGNVAKIENYKVVKKQGEKKDEMDSEIERSFSEKHLNDKMMIGLTDEGKIFFISEFETGAGEFYGMYDANGKILTDEENPCRIGEKSPEGEDDDAEGDDADEDDDDEETDD